MDDVVASPLFDDLPTTPWPRIAVHHPALAYPTTSTFRTASGCDLVGRVDRSERRIAQALEVGEISAVGQHGRTH